MFNRWISLPAEKSCLIIGPRRSGKTTLLKQRHSAIPYATLDDLDLLDWAKQDPKGFISHQGGHAIIDEIQRHPLLTVAVKYAIDNQDARFFMTGSSTIGLMDAAADTLAGRIEIDLVFEKDHTLYAIEIKSTRNPGPRDFHNLRQFKRQSERPVNCFLFYTGDTYDRCGDIRLIPIGALYRGC